jgi:hypothetical protein
VKLHSNTMVSLNTEIEKPPSTDTEWYELYKTVALQDPEWFEDHVASLFGSVEDDEVFNDELLELSRNAKEERIRRKTRQAQASRSIIEEQWPNLELVDTSTADDISPIPNASIEPPLMPELTNLSADIDIAEITVNETLAYSANSSIGIVARLDSVDTTESEGTAADDTTLDNNAVTTTTGSANQSVSSVDALEDRVVLYLDEDVWKRVDLSTLLQLGYSETEVNELQPTVIRLIATDVILRPRTGVPVRWLSPDNDGSPASAGSSIPTVQIVPASVAASILQELQTTVRKEASPSVHLIPNDVSTTTSANVETPLAGGPRHSKESVASIESSASVNRTDAEATRRNTSIAETKATGSSRIDSTNPSTVPKRRRTDVTQPPPFDEFPILPADPPSRSSPTGDSRSADRPRASSERSIDEPERRRRVYSGRPANRSERMEDPPPPKSRIWMDLDTFRNLLRDEAGMRLRILGNDWSDAIKDESDWRFDLYKKWLWTLHNGWGTPLVESRSDRARRSQRANGPPNTRKPPRNR